jgi:hypothetical protein
MGSWDAGYLHRECLEKRIGRTLTDDDLLFWFERDDGHGGAPESTLPHTLGL